MICDLHRLIDDQVPRIRAMPVRRPQKTGMGNVQQITGLIPVVQIPRNPMRNLIFQATSADDGPNATLERWKSCACIHIGLLAQRDSWLDEDALYVAWDALAGECGRSTSLARAGWPSTRPKI